MPRRANPENTINLYKYRGYDDSVFEDSRAKERAEKEIQQALLGKTWFAPLSSQNDPYDSQAAYKDSRVGEVKKFFDLFWARNVRYDLPNGRNAYRDLLASGETRNSARRILAQASFFEHWISSSREIWRAWSNHYISCLSASPTNNLLWAHYGASHGGMAFEFRSAEFADGMTEIKPVIYTAERPLVTTVDVLLAWVANDYGRLQSLGLTDDELDHLDKIRGSFKPQCWSYEEEWRANRPPYGPPGYHKLGNSQLSGVIFGSRASTKLMEFVMDRISGNVRFRKCVSSDLDFSFRLEDLT